MKSRNEEFHFSNSLDTLHEILFKPCEVRLIHDRKTGILGFPMFGLTMLPHQNSPKTGHLNCLLHNCTYLVKRAGPLLGCCLVSCFTLSLHWGFAKKMHIVLSYQCNADRSLIVVFRVVALYLPQLPYCLPSLMPASHFKMSECNFSC